MKEILEKIKMKNSNVYNRIDTFAKENNFSKLSDYYNHRVDGYIYDMIPDERSINKAKNTIEFFNQKEIYEIF